MTIKQSDLQRTLAAARKAGLPPKRASVDLASGKVDLYFDDEGPASTGPNPWDEDDQDGQT